MNDSAKTSVAAIDALSDLRDAVTLRNLHRIGDTSFELRAGRRNVWLVASCNALEAVALRAGFGAAIEGVPNVIAGPDDYLCEFATALGALRVRITFPDPAEPIVRATTWVLPTRDIVLSTETRDLFVPAAADGTVHASQRGLRSGIVYASARNPAPMSLFYVQNFSSLSAFYVATGRTPADSVGGAWPELGFLAPSGNDCILRKSAECVTSDVLLSVSAHAPNSVAEVAAEYLDRLAAVYSVLPKRAPEYHDWPDRAERTLRDVSLSPQCTYVRDGRRYLMPYVGDTTKPPESMVQLTALVNAMEYDQWRSGRSAFVDALEESVGMFFDSEIGSVVRWLPGSDFGTQSEANMDHVSMDSWYLYHSMFNLSRLASRGNEEAKTLFKASLPFAIRVARRFDYQWPIFFNLKTLDIIRAEAEPGRGGETDVAGLYALVMLHAHELFGDETAFAEAKRAAQHMSHEGFNLAYQMNTTGFAAEAALRLWQATRDRTYLELSEICMANMFDNMWLWECDYGHAKHYRTFFGLFPLIDAPYLAAYEELEAQAKFHDYLMLGGDDVRPSLRLLLTEYQKYGLDRGWSYYPESLPRDVIAPKARNGSVERALCVPLEDLQDGRQPSGQVGQELYGAGLAFIYTTRHYREFEPGKTRLFCSYPIYDVKQSLKEGSFSFRCGGDARGNGELRIIPTDPNVRLTSFRLVSVSQGSEGNIAGRLTTEGHLAFDVAGGALFELRRATDPRARTRTKAGE